MSATATPAARVYAWLTDEDHPESIACEDLPAEACRAVPRSFLANAGSGAATKLAEQIASPGLVIALLLGTLGAPVALVGLLEPVRRGVALVPQLAVSGRIRAVAVRKRFWVAAATVQAIVLGLMALAAASLRGAVAGVAVVGALAVFSLASGVGSVAFSDVIAKTIPGGKRGQLLGLRAALGGAATILAGLFVRARVGDAGGIGIFVVLLLCAAGLWVLAAGLFALVGEQPGATEEATSPLAEARRGFREVSRVTAFRRYVLARGLLLTVELALPFYALYGRRVTGGGGALGAFIAAVGVGQLVGSPLWGRLADRTSSRRVMLGAGAIGVLAAALALVLGRAVAGVSPFVFSAVFLLAALAEGGVRVGRKSYVADGAPPNRRSFYTATANTATGAVTLAFAVLGVAAEAIGVGGIIVVILVLGALGVAATWWMPAADALSGAPRCASAARSPDSPPVASPHARGRGALRPRRRRPRRRRRVVRRH